LKSHTGTAETLDYTTTTIQVTIPAGSYVDVVIPITDDLIGRAKMKFTVDGTVTVETQQIQTQVNSNHCR
jgi:hypothetical protein